MTTFYLCGPMRNRPYYNSWAFSQAAKALRAAGYGIISPTEMDTAAGIDLGACPTGTEDTGSELSDLMRRDLEAIDRSDGVVTLPGACYSTGAAVEIAYAKFLNKPVYELPELI